MSNTKITSTALSILFCVVALTATADAALIRLGQDITPRTCTLTIIATDTGFNYSIPEGCGRLMPNLVPAYNPTHTRLSAGSSELIERLFYNVDRTVFLDAALAHQPADGYMLFAEKGSVYTYYLVSDDKRGLPRSFEFVAIQSDKVALQFWPGGRVVWFAFDQHTKVDIDNDGVMDAAFRLIHVREDGTVLLHVRFLEQSAASASSTNQTLQIAAVSLMASGIAILLHAYVHEYLLRHRPPNREWWVNHPHEPWG